jgi:ankyrin repeat protein
LISKGANPNHQNDHGQTAAHFAIEYKFFEISSWLFEIGAADYIENQYGLTAYDGLSSGNNGVALLEN